MNAPTQTATPAPEAAADAVLGEALIRLAPTSLVLGPNVRDAVDTDTDQFRAVVDSVREHGVLLPILARRTGDEVTVIDGQVRTLAAIAADVDTVPVVVTDSGTDGAAAEIERLSRQIVANDRRIGLTVSQRAKAVADMLDLGVSATKVGKAVQMPRALVKTAAAAGRSETAREAVDAGQLTLEQAAIVAEFDADGDTDAVEELLERGRWGFDFTARRLLTEKAERTARADAGTAWAERGFTVLTTEPTHGDGYLRAEDLVTVDGGSEVTAEHIEATAAHWAVWLTHEEQFTDTATGEVVDAEEIDWSTEGEPDAEPEDGFRHHGSVTAAMVWTAEYVTADPAAAGVAPNAVLAAALAAPAADGDPDAQAQAREQARAAAELAAKEQARIERRRTVELNKASAAATEVRIEWLTKFLTRKTLPKDAGKWIAETLIDEPALLGENKAPQYLAQLLGVTVPDPTGPEAGYPHAKDRAARTALEAVLDKASDGRAQVLTLAQILAAYEARMSGKGHDSWRRTHYGNLDNYLGFLHRHGHHLTPTEQAAAAELTPEQAHQQLTDDTDDTDDE
ncbi:ParB/RepB/Spo0J family partition protein [Rhodococcoides corynebacterioides]|uniref:ParB/RepB/Spo0J family partition protein n=1 Tax=Rhodococcoides corynebacterioides TaxID=53972 RepID=UPI001C9B3E3A|nr:ParB N-terminal domain-containing protein [Rhodococcus corynebacterioides]MBY6352035.1 ParB N-terminal domain-containing protein [Rhodococcus corynebacterioides]